jgi:8-oxo-dGTP pyrophosphatase MutT (NUDIX family)
MVQVLEQPSRRDEWVHGRSLTAPKPQQQLMVSNCGANRMFARLGEDCFICCLRGECIYETSSSRTCQTAWMTRAEYLASLPKKRMAAGVLFRNVNHEALIVVPTYKSDLEIPGGIVEALESPLQAARREVAEELGLSLEIGRLLSLDYRQQENDEVLHFVFDGGILTEVQIEQIRLPTAELSEFRFVVRDQLSEVLTVRLASRLERAFVALEAGGMEYLDME